jgi:YfiH family protein
MPVAFETFAPLAALPLIAHGFTLRTADDTKADGYQETVCRAAGFDPCGAAWAEQTHGNGVVAVTGPGYTPVADGLVTRKPGLPLIVRCADCAAVYVVDRRTAAIGLAHSGKKGTQANIAGNMLATMAAAFGTRPSDCVAVISPCIGPCHYEVDLWAGIEAQLRAAGVEEIHGPRVCTACHLDRYYSYRAEKGQTGRMYALLALR